MDSFNCFNFVFILHKVTFHLKLHMFMEWPCLLAITKPLGGVHTIAMGESLYGFTSYVLCLQFHDAFATHFFPHQFKIVTKGGCETIIHSIKCTLNLHVD
jgi:hypothetical protein